MEERADPALVSLAGISKSFGANRVLHDVGFELRAGEVHALLGENGAGKSTLMKILMGIHQPDAGEVVLGGEPIAGQSVRDHLSRGIAMIFQELSLVPNGTVAENIFLGHASRISRGLWVDQRAGCDARRGQLIASLGFESVRRTPKYARCRFAQRQMVEILKAISRGARCPDHGRADLLADHARGSHPVCSAIGEPQAARHRHHLYQPSGWRRSSRSPTVISVVKDGRLLGPFRTGDVIGGQRSSP